MAGIIAAFQAWMRQRQLRRFCLHHDPESGSSFVKSHLLDGGRCKMTWCTRCQKTWIV